LINLPDYLESRTHTNMETLYRIYRFLTSKPPLPNQEIVKRISNLHITRDDVVLDCGANVGSITALLAQSKATVHAFEPNPYAYAKLQQAFRYYHNVHCY